MDWGAEAIVAAYAAIVATGALFLEVRRWAEEGPKLSISTMDRAGIIDGSAPHARSSEDYFIVFVDNRGSAITTITHLAFLSFPHLVARWRLRQSKSMIVPKPSIPGAGQDIPYELQPGKRWVGITKPDAETREWLESGNTYVAIYTTTADKPMLKRIKKLAAPPTDSGNIEGAEGNA